MKGFDALAGSSGAFIILYEGKHHTKISEIDIFSVSWWHSKLVLSLAIGSAVLYRRESTSTLFLESSIKLLT